MYNNKKGQAAMEFLMTYGWAILAAIIAIGVLAAFGVFSPGKLVQEQVVVNAPFNAKAAVVTSGIANSTANVKIDLLNGGDQVTVKSIAVEGCRDSANQITDIEEPKMLIGSDSLNITDSTSTAGGVTINSGQQILVLANCTVGLVSGSNFKGGITITYTKEGSTLPLLSTGSITAKAR